MRKTQMTVKTKVLTGASATSKFHWNAINWKQVESEVYRLQLRIAKAVREGRHGKAKALQWLLTHSFNAKLLAVKRVVQNTGKDTPGIDNVLWRTSPQRLKAALSLKRRGYKAQPLRRVMIPKKEGQKRPLSIPTMKDRAMQALHLLALEPIAEMKANKNSYGFRPKRSAQDALTYGFIVLARKDSAQWILDADIHSCFDRISHTWLCNNIPMDRRMLTTWLKAGYIEEGAFHRTLTGTAQGGIISPTLLNMTLSGLEDAVKKAVSLRDKVNICIYADDFIITGVTREVLEQKVMPTVTAFLKERGLELSHKKTKITHIDEGFDFLGMTIRKYNGKFLTQPSKRSVLDFVAGLRHTLKSHWGTPPDKLIHILNPKMRGWTQYYRHVCSKRAFNYVDFRMYNLLWKWARRRHPNKGAFWIKKKYFLSKGTQNWIFAAPVIGKDGAKTHLKLIQAHKVSIRRYIKIQAQATPYDKQYKAYFERRKSMLRGLVYQPAQRLDEPKNKDKQPG